MQAHSASISTVAGQPNANQSVVIGRLNQSSAWVDYLQQPQLAALNERVSTIDHCYGQVQPLVENDES